MQAAGVDAGAPIDISEAAAWRRCRFAGWRSRGHLRRRSQGEETAAHVTVQRIMGDKASAVGLIKQTDFQFAVGEERCGGLLPPHAERGPQCARKTALRLPNSNFHTCRFSATNLSRGFRIISAAPEAPSPAHRWLSRERKVP